MQRITEAVLLAAESVKAGKGFPCLFRLATGLYCPGCGGTRALRLLLKGDLIGSLVYHPLVAYMIGAAGIVMLLRLRERGRAAGGRAGGGRKSARGPSERKRKSPGGCPGYEAILVGIGVALILINWAVKNYLLAVRGIDLLRPLG